MFIARQPIFDRKKKVFGYELLFRLNSSSTQFGGVSSMAATGSVIGGLFESGIDSIVEDKCAFVNFDEEFIHSDSLELISPPRLVVEMLEDVEVDERLIERLNSLRGKGYRIALDDFVEDYGEYPLTPIADIIKYDLRATPLSSIVTDVSKALRQRKVLLAEKVENEEEFIEAKRMGFKLFQGYFFSKPMIVGTSIENTAFRGNHSMLLNELRKEEPSYQALAEIIEKDVNLSYRLMRAIKARSGEDSVHSIKRALTYMGFKEIDRWINIIMIQDLGNKKPKELARLSLLRSKFLERISESSSGYKTKKYEAFMIGLFSVMDAMLDQTIGDALRDIPVPRPVFEALVMRKGELYPLYDLTLAYEKGDWKKTSQLSDRLGIEDKCLYSAYIEAIGYAKEICKGICSQ